MTHTHTICSTCNTAIIQTHVNGNPLVVDEVGRTLKDSFVFDSTGKVKYAEVFYLHRCSQKLADAEKLRDLAENELLYCKHCQGQFPVGEFWYDGRILRHGYDGHDAEKESK